MFLHLGKDVTVPIKNVIAIIDLRTVSEAVDTRRFIEIAKEEGFIKYIGDDKPKSMIVCERTSNKHNKDITSIIYFSPISSSTLQRRAGSIE